MKGSSMLFRSIKTDSRYNRLFFPLSAPFSYYTFVIHDSHSNGLLTNFYAYEEKDLI